MGDVRTERGDLVPEGWAEIYRRARTDNYDGLSNAFTVLVITELASWQARAEQAEATIAAWKKDAEDRDKVIAELTAKVGQADEMARRAFVCGAKWWEWEKTDATMWQSDQARAWDVAPTKHPYTLVSRSTDLERDNG